MVTKPGRLRWTQLSGDVWVDDMEGYNCMMCRDLWNVMHRDSAVEGGASRHEKGGSWEMYLRVNGWTVICDLTRRYAGLNLSQHRVNTVIRICQLGSQIISGRWLPPPSYSSLLDCIGSEYSSIRWLLRLKEVRRVPCAVFVLRVLSFCLVRPPGCFQVFTSSPPQ